MSDKILIALEKIIQNTSKKLCLKNKEPDTNRLLALAKITGSYISLKKELRLAETKANQKRKHHIEKYGDSDYYDQMSQADHR